MISYSTLRNAIKFHLFQKKDQTLTENPLKIKKIISDDLMSDTIWGQQIHTTEQWISVTNSKPLDE